MTDGQVYGNLNADSSAASGSTSSLSAPSSSPRISNGTIAGVAIVAVALLVVAAVVAINRYRSRGMTPVAGPSNQMEWDNTL